MEHHMRTAEALTFLLESKFKFFKYSFGLDPLLNIIPWLGDFVGLLLSLYLVWIANQMKLPEHKVREMIRNVILDFVIGLIPFIGVVGDFVFKANTLNLSILKRHAPRIKEAIVLSSNS